MNKLEELIAGLSEEESDIVFSGASIFQLYNPDANNELLFQYCNHILESYKHFSKYPVGHYLREPIHL